MYEVLLTIETPSGKKKTSRDKRSVYKKQPREDLELIERSN